MSNSPYEENEDILQAQGYYEMDQELDKLEEAEDALQVALATYHYNLDPINRAAARYAQGEFLIDALKQEGAL